MQTREPEFRVVVNPNAAPGNFITPLATLLLRIARREQADAAFHRRMELELAQLDLLGSVLLAQRAGEPTDTPHLRQLARRVLDLAAALKELSP